ncbi:MAG: BON domain-containing protein [Casimicrobiaceae bacterium]
MKFRAIVLPLALAATAATTGPLISGCVPVLAVAAIGGGALVAADRRSAGAQIDDETIELKIANAVRANHGTNVHLNVTSYSGTVLLTGEVPDERARESVANIARGTDRVKSVQNELVVAQTTSLGDRSNDTLITSKVKARFVEANEFAPYQVKVVTERGVVYLMGIVNRTEADAAARLAAQTSGVRRVVRVFEYV